jgi:cytochrome c553
MASIDKYSVNGQMMVLVRSRIAALAIMVSAVPSLADAETVDVKNCTWCHGLSGQGDSIAPRLAGQRPQYIESQLLSFRDHTRNSPFSKQYMWGAVAALSTKDRRYLATYFSALPPKAANDGNSELAATGRTIYEDGIPNSNVAACAACHGPNAEGIREIPRLAGLSHAYLKRRLKQWAEGYHAAAAPPMPRIASKLPPDIIDAVASYLSFVK